MSEKFLNGIDLAQTQISNAVIQVLASAPGSPVLGQTYFNSVSNHTFVYNGTSFEQASGGGGSGTVTSVGLTVPSWLSVAGSPVTTSGTLAVTAAGSQTANSILATPDGAAGTLSVRTLAVADIPSLTSAKVSDFSTAVHTIVDPLIQGLQIKPTATVVATSALPAGTYSNGASGVGATFTVTATGTTTVDGHALAAGDLVLLTAQASAFQNGLYTVTTAGTTGVSSVLTRHADMDQAAEFSGALVPAGSTGTANANSLWLANPSGAVTVGTTSIPFTELNKATDLAAGTGITISGNTVSVATSYAGGSSIVTVGTITAGTWTGTAIAVANGGTGSTTAAGARTNLGAVGRYSATVGDGSSTAIAITQATHGLASNGQMHAMLYDASTGAQVYTDVTINNANGTITLTFATAPSSNAYRIVVIG